MKSFSRTLALEGNIRVLAAQTLISQIGFGMFYVIWQPYLLSTGISIGQLGVIQTMINVSTGLGLLAWGYVSDNYGRRPVVIASDVCRVAAMAVLIVSRHYYALLVFSFFIGFTAMFMMGNPGRNALITESVDSARRATAFSTLLAVSQGTSTLMASVGGYIAVKAGYTPILYVTLVVDLIGLTLLYFYLEETHTPDAGKKDAAPIWTRIRDALLPEGENVVLYLLMLTMGFGYAVAYSLFYGALTDYQGFTPLELGFMSTSFNLVWALGSIPVGKLRDRVGRKRMLMASVAMAYVTITGFIVFRSVWAFVLFNGVSALDVCFWMPSWMSLISEIVPQERRSSVLGKLDAYGRAGAVPAPWLAGLLLERYGFTAPLYVQLVTLFIGLFFVTRIRDR
jgi:DHA1 family quinolone resistance protein-like MFS transporter